MYSFLGNFRTHIARPATKEQFLRYFSKNCIATVQYGLHTLDLDKPHISNVSTSYFKQYNFKNLTSWSEKLIYCNVFLKIRIHENLVKTAQIRFSSNSYQQSITLLKNLDNRHQYYYYFYVYLQKRFLSFLNCITTENMNNTRLLSNKHCKNSVLLLGKNRPILSVG